MEVNTMRTMERSQPNADFNANISTATSTANRSTSREVNQTTGATVNNSAPAITAESLRNELIQLQETISAEFFEKFIQEANIRLFPTNRRFNYDFHEATNRIVVRIVDRYTDEVIREIPPDKILNVAERMLELVGVIFDESV